MSTEIFENTNILIIDDDKVIIKLLETQLDDIGIKHYASAKNGVEGLDAYDATKSNAVVNVILLDLNMPGMDGVEFLRHIAERHYEGDIILMSGEDKAILKSAGDLARAHDLSIVDIIEKPVTLATLEKALNKVINKRAVVRNAQGPKVEVSVDELKEALAKDQLVMYFQPKIDVNTKSIASVEALVRWAHPEKGMIPPDAFISLAEHNNLIDDLTALVLKKSLKQAGEWHAAGHDFKVAVNISVDNLHSLDFPDQLTDAATKNKLKPGSIILEVTESRLMKDLTKTFEILTRLRLKGFELSIDDFGTGFSSMEQLERIPFTELKIDKAFITDADQKPKSLAILETSVSLAKSLGLRTVAEGVETQAEWDLVKATGVDLVQGYFISKPLPAEELSQWLKEKE